jgi:hypothetical protein
MPLVDLLKRLGVRKEPAVKCCLCPFANSTGPVDQRSRIPSEQRGDGAYRGLCLAHKGARALLLAANNVGRGAGPSHALTALTSRHHAHRPRPSVSVSWVRPPSDCEADRVTAQVPGIRRLLRAPGFKSTSDVPSANRGAPGASQRRSRRVRRSRMRSGSAAPASPRRRYRRCAWC